MNTFRRFRERRLYVSVLARRTIFFDLQSGEFQRCAISTWLFPIKMRLYLAVDLKGLMMCSKQRGAAMIWVFDLRGLIFHESFECLQILYWFSRWVLVWGHHFLLEKLGSCGQIRNRFSRLVVLSMLWNYSVTTYHPATSYIVMHGTGGMSAWS